MAGQTLTKRVEILEKSMTEMAPLPGRVNMLERSAAAPEASAEALEAQFLQFRAEVRDEFAAMNRRFDRVDAKIDQRFDELKNHMLVLHESVIERFKWLGEGRRKRR